VNVLRFVPVFVDAEDVVHRFGRRSFRAPFSLEMIHVPHVLFRYRVSWTPFFGGIKSAEGLFGADLVQGRPMNIAKSTKFVMEDGLRNELAELVSLLDPPKPKRTVGIERREIPEEKLLPAVLDEAAAVERARSVFKYDLMRLVGGLRVRSMEIKPLPGARTVYYPYWLLYHKGRDGAMRFDPFDALSGQRERGDTAQTIKIALLKKEGKI
jgi:hypothetical protein